jgi:hypothetical protein
VSSLRLIGSQSLECPKVRQVRTPDGKTFSSMNALKFGVHAQPAVIRGENSADTPQE